MRIFLCLVLALTLLTGCGKPKDFETMSDSFLEPEPPLAQQMIFLLPEDAAKAVLEDPSAGTLYLCDGYTVAVQTLPAGNLDATVREVTGYGREQVRLWQRKDGAFSRYMCVWASAGEGGDQMGKTTILDDGSYHYVLSVMAAAEDAGSLAETWQELMDSFRIVP